MSQDAPSSAEEKRFFGRLRKGLAKTRDQLTSGVGNLLLGEKEISAEALEDLETALLTTDVGVETTRAIIDELTSPKPHAGDLQKTNSVAVLVCATVCGLLVSRALGADLHL